MAACLHRGPGKDALTFSSHRHILLPSYNKASDQSWVHYGCNVDLNDVLFQHAFLVVSEACVQDVMSIAFNWNASSLSASRNTSEPDLRPVGSPMAQTRPSKSCRRCVGLMWHHMLQQHPKGTKPGFEGKQSMIAVLPMSTQLQRKCLKLRLPGPLLSLLRSCH